MKKALKNILLVLLFIVIIAVVGIIVYSITSDKKILGDIIPVKTNTDVEDYHNGIYFREEPLNRSYAVYTGCNVSSFTTYIVVMNDTYYVYYGSCMKNTMIEEGKTEDLVFTVNKNTKKYQITYDDKIFDKNDKVNSVVESDYLKQHFNESSIDVLDFVLKYGQTEGDYKPVNVKLSGSYIKYNLLFSYNNESKVFQEKVSSMNTDIYTYTYLKMEDRPKYDFMENSLISLEPVKITNGFDDNFKYRYNLILMGDSKIKYDLKKEFPMTVNGVQLDTSKNIYIAKKNKSTYGLIIGDLNTFCDNDKKDSEEISYYEFDIKYNYTTKSFDSPELVKMGKYSEGCNYIKKYYLGG